jgi:hypothetical protein
VTAGQVRIVCTDRGTHPSRELAVMRRLPHWPELEEVMRAAPEIGPANATMLVDWDRTGAIESRNGRRPDGVSAADVEALAPGEDTPPRWRLRCPTCRRDVPLRHQQMTRLVAGVLDSDTPSRPVDVSYLPARFTST